MASDGLIGSLTPTTTNVAEGSAVVLGTAFTTLKAGKASGVEFFAPTTVGGTYEFTIGQVTSTDETATPAGTQLATTGVVSTAPTAGAKNSYTFSSPLTLTPGTWYKALVKTSQGRYTATNDFFTAGGGGASGLTSAGAGVYAAYDGQVISAFGTIYNGTFAGGTGWPGSHFRSTFYFVGPLFDADVTTTPFTKTAAETYRVLNAWAATAVDAYRVLNAWTKSGSDSYRVLNGWTKAQTETYRVFAIWAKAAAETYRVLNALAKTSPEVYNVLNAWSATRPETYRVLNALNVTGADLYRIFNTFTKDVVETYNVLNGTAFSKTAAEAYRVYNAFLKTADEAYRVLAPLAVSRGETYRVLNTLGLTAPESYRVSNSLSLARPESYRVLNSLGLTRPELYNILGASFLVEAPEQYRVFATWLKNAIERYNVGDIAPSTRTISAVANLAPRSVRASLDLQTVVAYLDEVD
jgi:hypothetical protein